MPEPMTGEATLNEIVTLYIEAPWSLSLSKSMALRGLRRVRNFFFGVEETDKWFAKRYKLVAWFNGLYPRSTVAAVIRGRRG